MGDRAALVHVVLGSLTIRGRISREIALLLLAVGIGLSAIGLALALDGPALVAAWSVEACCSRGSRGGRSSTAATSPPAASCSAHSCTLMFDAPPEALVEDPPRPRSSPSRS